jgi:hypothetical protein
MEYLAAGSAVLLSLIGFAGWYGRRPWRSLPEPVVEKLKTIPMARPRYSQHLVDLVLDDGGVIRRVYVGLGRYPSLSLRRWIRPYSVNSVVDVRPRQKD